ncbi:NAD kinase [Quadrisphaera sp. DSM 44207]|uniref:NAD kinase n=1 Tax=Quadrisphaera sp. DSM 44207 TaxID=1881057 RepID=UPI00088940F4|nr:NAD kinase [Quadrisphaera sp. DSM 44207]SDQ51216.1 NAD+ kinase [Quadrisphaera sp. DSM 44207]
MSDRRVLVLTHTGRAEAVVAAQQVVRLLDDAGLHPVLLDEEAQDIPGCDLVERVPVDGATDDLELVLVLGGDGSVLRAAELVHGSDVPLLGVNLGHVGFLAETEPDALESTVRHVAERDYEVEERMTLGADLVVDGRVRASSWALNEVSIEKGSRERMLELVTEVDGRPVSTYGCDGVVVATPTGSTAYAFSAGGPVVWPAVQALVMVPISAHALFARPLVVSPESVMAVEVLERNAADGVMWCDGRRAVVVPRGGRIEVRRGQAPVRLARIATGPFTDRLVAKFRLAVGGWRGPDERRPHLSGAG